MSAIFLAISISLGWGIQAPEGDLYRVMLLRAAPGELASVIDLYRNRAGFHERAGDRKPYILRHSQGDQWDLMLIYPISSFREYFSEERETRLEVADRQSGLSREEFHRALNRRLAWREEIFVVGEPVDEVDRRMSSGAYYHVEMFHALPGKQDALLEERAMENVYLAHLGRPRNLIFRRVAGASWDSFTVGVYRDLAHFAESSDIPDQLEEEAARVAGFAAADSIGTYLRTLIHSHHDTLARAVRYEPSD